MATREDFRNKLLVRDGRCVWTGLDGLGMHIIPYNGLHQRLQLIIDNRPHLENLESLINDIRNGIYAEDGLHNHYFDPRGRYHDSEGCFLLLSPLSPTNIAIDPQSHSRNHRHPKLSPTTGYRPKSRFPGNISIYTSMDHQNLPNPADLLLHYNSGAAAVKQWGKNIGILTNRLGVPRSSVPTQAGTGPTRLKHDGNVAIRKQAEDSISQKDS
ncbi:hypothetical protein BYT27DRAFT_7250878 [Phlegmacium glaucopus]|nr:hypothetical protein BYT27DRAFT_7250878 [Phlegmacium glaucopus]